MTKERKVSPDLTLFSDASVAPKTRASGWGCWCKGDGRKAIEKGGPLQQYHPSTDVAEAEAIANAMTFVSEIGYIVSTDRHIMIQCDNTVTLAAILQARPSAGISNHAEGVAFNPRRKPPGDRLEQAVSHILEIADKHCLSIILRHVRGHKPGGGRQYVNRRCDALAKAGRREAEKQQLEAAQ